MWLQPLAMSDSHLFGVVKDHIGAAGREGLHIRRRGPALGAGKGGLNRREIVKGQGRDQMEGRRSRRESRPDPG